MSLTHKLSFAPVLAAALLSLSAGCPSDDASSPDKDAGSQAADAETPDEAVDAGDTTKPGDDAAVSATDSGTTEVADSGGGEPMPSDSPCAYTVSDAKSFPTGDVTYLCQVGSRILQTNGEGDYTLLMTVAAFNEATGDSSMIACSLSSDTPPKAGDVWTLDSGSGNCDLTFQHDSVGAAWKASSPSPKLGSLSVTFKSASEVPASAEGEDVYYLFDLTYTGTFEGQTEGATEISATGKYTATAKPFGT